MNIKIATWLYMAGMVVMPISVASKNMLGMTDTIWVDPTLVLSAGALLLLFPHWGDFISGELRAIAFCGLALAIVSIICALSGFILSPTDSLYDVFREPLRLCLNLSWLLVTCWFLLHKPNMVTRFAGISVFFALCTGIYLYLVVFGLAPAPPQVVTYMRLYSLRQLIWLNGIPVPRMGGLFIEAPPFGLYMFSMLAVLFILHRDGIRSHWTIWGKRCAVLGILLSMADQVLLGWFVWLIVSLPIFAKKNKTIWSLVVISALILGAFEVRSIGIKEESAGAEIVSYINGNSVGERNFHLRYGLSLLQVKSAATLFGIGPGRYGEYVSQTGDYPDTVNMQISEPEILVEWGVLGLFFWVILILLIATRVWKQYRLLGIGLLLGLLIADSFQANWKQEAVFLAIAVLCTRNRYMTAEANKVVSLNVVSSMSKAQA